MKHSRFNWIQLFSHKLHAQCILLIYSMYLPDLPFCSIAVMCSPKSCFSTELIRGFLRNKKQNVGSFRGWNKCITKDTYKGVKQSFSTWGANKPRPNENSSPGQYWGHGPPVEKCCSIEKKKKGNRWNLLRALVEVAHDAIILLF